MAGDVWQPCVSVRVFSGKPHIGELSRNDIPEYLARTPRGRGGTSLQLGAEGPSVIACHNSRYFEPKLWVLYQQPPWAEVVGSWSFLL